ncbi:MAG: hypothetical protein KIT09_34350 [Bryobacteraceae bacterium]|nr:hypothetical protein [Bryobacteraceae bacterium]
MILLALVLATASGRLLIVDETVRVAPGEYVTVSLGLQQRAAVVDLSFRTETPSPGISVALLGPTESRARDGVRREFLRVVYDQRDGAFRFPARRLGDYEILVDNRGNKEKEAVVALRVALGFNDAGIMRPETLSPERRVAVVALSLLFLTVVALWSGRKLLDAIARRKLDEQLPLF